MIGHWAPARRAPRRSRLVAVSLGLAAFAAVVWQAYQVDAAHAERFGNTTPGELADHGMFANYKIVHAAKMWNGGSVTKLSVYAIPGINSPSPQALRAVIYSDSGGSPGSLLAAGTEVTYRGDVDGSGWFNLPFASPVSLSAGSYWLGFITGTTTEGMGYVYRSVANSRAYNVNAYASGPSSMFGALTRDSEQASIYATYTRIWAPVNAASPTISGSPQQGQLLTASPGTWTNEPTAYSYQWQRCDGTGANCSPIAQATSSSYMIASADAGRTLRVAVVASNIGGSSKPGVSDPTAVASGSATVQRLEYVLNDGLISVYDIDNKFALVKTISLPQAAAGVRGVAVAPGTHEMFISYGGDGGGNGNGSVLAYDLVTEKVVWEVHLSTGIDSGALSPDGKRLYMPTGENSSSGIWNILDTSNGALIGTIQGGAGAHNTIASADGRYVYLGGRNHRYLDVYETSTGLVREVGPLVGGVRPFTVNSSNTLAFTTATEYDGFQVSSLITGKVLVSISFGTIPSGFPFTTASHGISLSPDEKQLYVLDAVNKELRVYDVSGLFFGITPKQLGSVALAGLSGSESPCAYDCGRDGWLQDSIDGRFLFVGDSGEVIEAATRRVVANLATLANTRKSIEVEWANGVPVATSTRTGVGKVRFEG
jgi:hypothetical protein